MKITTKNNPIKIEWNKLYSSPTDIENLRDELLDAERTIYDLTKENKRLRDDLLASEKENKKIKEALALAQEGLLLLKGEG